MEQVIMDLADKILENLDIPADKELSKALDDMEGDFRVVMNFDLNDKYYRLKKAVQEYYENLIKKYSEIMFDYGVKMGLNFKNEVKDF